MPGRDVRTTEVSSLTRNFYSALELKSIPYIIHFQYKLALS